MYEANCPRCGKNFITAPYHIYHDDKGFYCSWTCYNHRDEVVFKRGKKPKAVEQYTKEGEKIATFKDALEAATSLSGIPNGIRCACNNHTSYKGYLWRYKNDLP